MTLLRCHWLLHSFAALGAAIQVTTLTRLLGPFFGCLYSVRLLWLSSKGGLVLGR